ncbi:hypothetical protein H2199_004300 [Coniosporium tulheliwenetii]|uniref:Uncharacterized protein n=1 Tax=Coniosporium tulheliwenetii TaxID=3383036 RepID=A0ACC2Z8N6_9PEZI|nr:hypothetical protein H2199_004300 [Cladosporium sp. JES 115]
MPILLQHNDRDEMEHLELFPQDPLTWKVGSNNTDEHLDNYWKSFHPSYPILHLPTFNAVDASPLLKASMMIIGALYDNQPPAKSEAKLLHERCLKVVAKRYDDMQPGSLQPRLCDQQALFLLEFYSQFKSRRLPPVAVRRLNNAFETMFHQLLQDREAMPTGGFQNPTDLNPGGDYETACRQWADWIRLSSKQRLLVATIILRTQKASLLARDNGRPMFQATDLPFPCSTSIWDAPSAVDWVDLMHLNSSSLRRVSEALEDSSIQRSVPFDSFQSAVLIAGCYNTDLQDVFLYMRDRDSFEQGLDQSYASQMHYHATLLSQNTLSAPFSL